MRTRHVLAALTMGLVGMLSLAMAGTPASAVTSADSGWWTSAPPLATAGVPKDGLLIEGGVDDPVAYAAVAFELEDDEQPVSLQLDVVPDTVATPESGLRLCPLTEPFTPAHGDAHGEPMDDAPAYDCTAGIPATAGNEGTTFTFDLGDLPAGQRVMMAVTPTRPVDRVVLQRPRVDSLQTQSSPTGSGAIPPPPPMPETGSPTAPAPGVTPDSPPPPPPAATPTPPPSAAPALAPPPPPDPAPTQETAPAAPTEQADQLGSLASPPLASSVNPLGDEGSLAGRLAFAAVVLGALTAWAYAGRRRVNAVGAAH